MEKKTAQAQDHHLHHNQGHVAVVAYPAQSHINQALQFSRRLVAKGLHVTFVTTVSISKSLHLGSTIDGQIHLDVISDGFDEDPYAQAACNAAYFASHKTVGSHTLAQLITKYNHQSQSSGGQAAAATDNSNHETRPPIQALVYDSFMPWALGVAKQFGLVAAAFFAQPCSVEYIYYNVYSKSLSLPISSTPVSIPGLPLLELQDFPCYISDLASSPDIVGFVANQFSNLDQADYVLFNTFYRLEKEVVDMLSKNWPGVLTIGPTIPSIYLEKGVDQTGNETYGVDIFSFGDQHINPTNWLNSKPAGSVVYVAFGSMVKLSEKQMEELASGLKRILSNSSFSLMWVIRESEEAKVPRALLEEIMAAGDDNCLIMKWSSQVKMLSHQAVGCFLTHCGWSSTMEALSLGVPMVAMPKWGDQLTIGKLVQDVWKVGIRVRIDEDSGIVKGEEIEHCIKEVMTTLIAGESKGREMKANAKRWRELAIEAVSEGGTSDKCIHDFASKLKLSR